MQHEHKATFTAVTEDGRLFTVLEFEEYRLDIGSGPRTERIYGANSYRVTEFESGSRSNGVALSLEEDRDKPPRDEIVCASSLIGGPARHDLFKKDR